MQTDFNRESLRAFFSAKVGDRCTPVLMLLHDNPHGLTQDECASALGLLTQTASGIFTELLKFGLAMRKPIPGRKDYETRETRSSNSAAVIVLSPDVRQAAATYRQNKRMIKEEEKARRNALAENAELREKIAFYRELVGDLIEIIEGSREISGCGHRRGLSDYSQGVSMTVPERQIIALLTAILEELKKSNRYARRAARARAGAEPDPVEAA